VGLIFKTHLDLGFTDLASAVYRRYMEEFLPNAVRLALANRDGSEPFVWTTGSFLVSRYLEHAKGRAGRDLEEALGAGLIRWHALPFTFQTEALDEALLESALRISARLDERFGTRTRAAKMTDVPGHTRGLIPTLAAAGVDFLHIGVNPASQVPSVPPLFRWRHPEGAEITVCCDGTYGGYCKIPGEPRLFAIAMTGDNAGPPGQENVTTTYRELRFRFPNAVIHATTLEALADSARKSLAKLPVVTSEIGDTWIHGYGSDPWKMAAYRHLAAARHRWVASGALDPESKIGRLFDENLLLSMEHTWGLDEKTWMSNGKPLTKILNCYHRREFEAARKLPSFRRMEESWQEQRGYIEEAIRSLPSPLQKEAREFVKPLRPGSPPTHPGKAPKVSPTKVNFSLGGQRLEPGIDGSLIISSRPNGWLGLLRYEVFGEEDYQKYLQRYVRKEEREGIWAPYDFGKPGCGSVIKKKLAWTPRVIGSRKLSDEHVLLELAFPKICSQRFGAPAILTLEIRQADASTLDMELRWYEKPATRIAEALWFHFRFPVSSRKGWWIHKLGGEIDPFDVVPRGSRHLHIANHGAGVRSPASGNWTVSSQEAALLAPGTPRLVDYRTSQPDPHRNGLAFNLLNNTWGTNFPMWYEDNAMFKFRVTHEAPHPRSPSNGLA
jgi:hypothetical protein